MRLSCLCLAIGLFGVLGLSVAAPAAVWTCSTIGNVENAMRGYAPGDEIVLNPGTYIEEAYIRLERGAVTFRGSTGNRDDVIIQGPGINANIDPKEGVTVISDGVTVKDLTIKGFFWNGLHITGENDTDNTIVRNVKILDCGERYIKGSTNTASATSIVDNALIESVYMEQLTALSGHPDNDYVGGIDMMGVNAVTIHDCIAKNIHGATGGGRGGIFLWNGINNPTVERNQIIGCDRGIAMGNPAAPGHAYMPNYHVTGGIVRNNFVTRGAGIGMELCFTNNLKVYYNTIYSADATYFRTVQIYDSAGQTTNLQLKYNIIRGVILNSSTGTWSETGDITGSTPATNWFVAPATGDLHLTSNATLVIDHGVSLAEVTDDFDKQARGASPDVGADEYQSGANQAPTVDAGTNQAITWPTNVVNLDGTVSDDGLPNPPAAVTTIWSKVSGPGTVVFGNVYAVDTTATFGQTGTYVLQLLANDSVLQTTDTVTITVNDTAAPTFVAAGTVASGTGTITPALPAGLQANDILLLFVETANQTISITNQNGGTWTQVTGSPQGTGTAGGTAATSLTVFWSRYNGTQGAPTTSDSGDHQLGRIIAIRGATTSGNPRDVTAGGIEATSDTSGSIPGATTTVANTLVVVAIATSLPDANSTAKFSGWTNANLSSLTERTDNSVNAGNGGGLAIATGGKATAGAYGATAVTLVNAAQKGMMSIALKP